MSPSNPVRDNLSLLEVGSDGRLTEEFEASVAAAISSGHYDGHVGSADAYFHTADDLRAEIVRAGFRDVSVLGVEGPAWPALDSAGMGQFESRVDAAVRSARMVEQDPPLINASAHLLAVGHK
jgi:hypothetical protein